MGDLRDQAEREDDPVYHELRITARKLSDEVRKEKARTHVLVEAVYSAAHDAALMRGAVKIPPAPKFKASSRHEYAILHTTDWQVGKLTATYNAAVAEDRLAKQMPDRVERLTTLHREGVPVSHCLLLVGGDMVEGVTIFPGQAHAIDIPLYDQLFLCVDILTKIIQRLLAIFHEVEVYEEKGNHGRLGKKGEMPSSDNVDLMMYEIVRRAFAHEPRVKWHKLPSPGVFHRFTVGNYTGLLFHGDEIKGAFGNLPQFAIQRRVVNWRSIWFFHDAFGGHYHTPYTIVMPDGKSRIFGCGSPESDNDFAVEWLGAMGDPSQNLFYLDAERPRLTAQYLLNFNYEREG